MSEFLKSKLIDAVNRCSKFGQEEDMQYILNSIQNGDEPATSHAGRWLSSNENVSRNEVKQAEYRWLGHALQRASGDAPDQALASWYCDKVLSHR